MPKEFSRTQRLAEQIKRDLASLLQFEVKDPRLGMVTINAVKVSKDLSYADVYFTVLNAQSVDGDDQETIKITEEVLNDELASFLRSELSKGLRSRFTPNLRFHYDVSLTRGHHLTSLINKAVKEDQRNSESSKSNSSDSEDNGE